MKYDLKGHIMPKTFQHIRLWTNFDKSLYECYYHEDTIYDLKCHFYIMEFCDFFTLRPADLIKTLTYVLMDNFCPCYCIYLKHVFNV